MGDVMGPSPYQARALAAPETYNQLHVGGRGGGKTRCMEFAIARHCEKHGARAHVLVARRTFPGLRDFERSLHHVLVLAFGERWETGQSDNADASAEHRRSQ